MIKMICDRCGEEINGTTYYTVNIHANDINPRPDETVTCSTALQNFYTNLEVMFKTKRQYCEKCRDEIEQFINKSFNM